MALEDAPEVMLDQDVGSGSPSDDPSSAASDLLALPEDDADMLSQAGSAASPANHREPCMLGFNAPR